MANSKKLVIIGGGIAGVSAAQSAREHYPLADIILIGDETPFYNKIALGSFITNKISKDHLRFNPANWLEEQQIQTIWNTPVWAIDTQNKRVKLDGEKTVIYDTLILATGATPFLPPINGINSAHCFPLWSLSHAQKIKDQLPDANNIAIIGGGVLGVEAAFDLSKIGKQITIFETKPGLMPGQLSAKGARYYEQQLGQFNIDTVLNCQVSQIETINNRPIIKLTDNKTYAFDMILVMTGVIANTQLAETAGIEVNRGIVVNGQMQTSAPDIFACGNCTEIDNTLSLLWNSAMEQGQVAGANGFEPKSTWQNLGPTIHVKTPDIPLFSCGLPSISTNTIKIEETTPSGYKQLTINLDGQIINGVFINDTQNAHLIETAIHQQTKLKNIGAQTTIDQVISQLVALDNNRHSHEAWVCQMCGYVAEGPNAPEICPVCCVGKDQFLAA